jgi:aminoglycoside phosphotransferase (APT) family kinase protein
MRVVPPELLERIAGRRVIRLERLTDGFRNSNFKLTVDGAAPLVLRVYEHDPALCRKELDLRRLMGAAVPLPEVVRAEPDGCEGLPPFVLTRFVEGISYRELRRRGDAEAVGEAARSAGETLAAIGRFRFEKPGWIAPGPTVSAPLMEGENAVPRFVDRCLASPLAAARVPTELRERIRTAVWRGAAELAPHDRASRLAHGDFNKRNLIVRETAGVWRVAAVLDWEFAVSGSPLMDIANFLRYDRPGRPRAEPHFSRGYREGGGELTPDWRRLAWLIDLAAIGAALAAPDTPEEAVADLIEAAAAEPQ